MTDASLFVSYRRTDTAVVLRLCARLKARFGHVRIFLDVQDIAPGQPWAAALTATLAVCACVLVIIGPEWIETLQTRALLKTPDYVRLEVLAALRRHILVIPVMVNGGRIPMPEQLPPDLATLSGRQAFTLREASFEADALRLSDAIADHMVTP